MSGLTVRLNQPFRPRAQVSNIVSNKVVFPFRCLDQDVPRNCSKAKIEFIKVLDITTLNNFYNGDMSHIVTTLNNFITPSPL